MKNKGIGVLSLLAGALAVGTWESRRRMKIKADSLQELSDKHLALFLMMRQWVKVKQEGKNLSAYFEEKGYHEIAIYGMSYAGEALADELEGTGIKVKYGIDQRADSICAEFEMVTKDDALENVDAIVVTPIKFFDEIEEDLGEKVSCPIVSLEDILYEI